MQFLHNASKNVIDIPADQEWAGTKDNLNHKDHEEFEAQHFIIFF